MDGYVLVSRWLADAAAGGLIVLAFGSLAARLCRQPVQRARVVVLTLVAGFAVPWLGALPDRAPMVGRFPAAVVSAAPPPPTAAIEGLPASDAAIESDRARHNWRWYPRRTRPSRAGARSVRRRTLAGENQTPDSGRGWLAALVGRNCARGLWRGVGWIGWLVALRTVPALADQSCGAAGRARAS